MCWAPRNPTPSSQRRKRSRNHSPVLPVNKLRCREINKNCSKRLRGGDSAGIRTQGSRTPARVLLTAPRQAAGATPPEGAKKPRGEKASPVEPPNTLHVMNHGTARQHQAPGQSPARPCPPQALGPAWDIPNCVHSGHASTTHHEGPAPLVLAEAVASPGARGHRRHLPEQRLIVLKGILPPRWHLRHRTQEKDFTGASLFAGRICHTERVHSDLKGQRRKLKLQMLHPHPPAPSHGRWSTSVNGGNM